MSLLISVFNDLGRHTPSAAGFVLPTLVWLNVNDLSEGQHRDIPNVPHTPPPSLCFWAPWEHSLAGPGNHHDVEGGHRQAIPRGPEMLTFPAASPGSGAPSLQLYQKPGRSPGWQTPGEHATAGGQLNAQPTVRRSFSLRSSRASSPGILGWRLGEHRKPTAASEQSLFLSVRELDNVSLPSTKTDISAPKGVH